MATSKKKQKKHRKPNGNVDWDKVADLGKVSDRALAKRYGVSPQAVSQARLYRGIPAHGKGGRPRMTKKERASKEKSRIEEWTEATKGWDWTLSAREMTERYLFRGKRISTSMIYKIRDTLGIAIQRKS